MNELLELDRIRLDEDLSYGALAKQIGISESNLSRALRRVHDPRDRTLHKIRRFLESRRHAPRRRKEVAS